MFFIRSFNSYQVVIRQPVFLQSFTSKAVNLWLIHNLLAVVIRNFAA